MTTRIRQLEQDLGIDLFVREGKKMHLTPAGQILLGYADRLLALADEARVAVQDTAPCGQFRLGAMESTAAVRLPAVLSEFSRRYPDVELELRTGNPDQLAAELLAGTVEAAFFSEPIAEKRFEAVPAFRENVVIVTSRDCPVADDLDPAPRTVLVFEAGCPHRRALLEWYAGRGEIPDRVVELGSYHAMFGCVLAGMGAALVPKSVIGSFPENDRLRIHDLPQGRRHLTTHLVWRRGMQSAKVHGLANILAGSENRAGVGV